jgi:hypothetical protein
MEERDDINKYLTWSNVWKVIAIVCSCVWFISGQINSDSVRDIQQIQTQKDVSDIKIIVKDIQSDNKSNAIQTDIRLNNLEKDVKVMQTQIDSYHK